MLCHMPVCMYTYTIIQYMQVYMQYMLCNTVRSFLRTLCLACSVGAGYVLGHPPGPLQQYSIAFSTAVVAFYLVNICVLQSGSHLILS